MSNKKQTAIDFAVEKLEKLIPSGHQIIISIILEKAKEMERQQIIDFANNYGFDVCGYDYERAEQYYKETYETSN